MGYNVLMTVDCCAIGDAAELFAMAILRSTGTKIAIPFGNQSGFDFLMEKDGSWLRVQSRAAQVYDDGKAVCSGVRTVGRKNRTTKILDKTDTDYIAASNIARSTLWIIPIESVRSKKISLSPDYIVSSAVTGNFWKPKKQTLPALPVLPKPEPQRRHDYLRRALAIHPDVLEGNRHPMILPETWELLLKYVQGYSYRKIGSASGCRKDTIASRIWNASRHLLPEDERVRKHYKQIHKQLQAYKRKAQSLV